MGGSWEALIKIVKNALRVVLKERAPKEETLATLFAEVEHIVNTRPLTHISVDHRDEEALTPNHFLLGSSSGVVNPGRFSDADLCSRKQWRQAQRLADMFWNRWLREYLPLLTPRQASGEHNPLKTGDVVIIIDPSMPRNVWPRGVVTKTFPGKDKKIRVVEVQTNRGVLRRPANKIIKLPTTNTKL